MAVQFKFREAAPPAKRKDVVERLKGKGKVKPLFPGEKDPELASLYRVEELADEPTQREVVAMLEDDDSVEFAEAEAERKPMG